MRHPLIYGLYAIADAARLPEPRRLAQVARALAGGARMVQYRDKADDGAASLRAARALARLCRDRGVPLIINDRVELAAEVGAGVHLGRDDMPLAQARALLGKTAIIGVSCYNELARAAAAESGGADYVAFGSLYASRTKPGAARADLALIRRARERIDLPIVAIGGITPDNGAAVIAAGADALAVIDGLFGQEDVGEAAARYARLFAGRAPGGGTNADTWPATGQRS